MESSLEASRAIVGSDFSRVVEDPAPEPSTRRVDGPWRVAGSLVLIAFGIAFGVALARLHWTFGGQASADGLSQGFVLRLYEGFGFAASFYFFLLVTAWGLLAFFGCSVRSALRRLAIAIVFVAAFAAMSDLLGGNGGDFGAWVAQRLHSGIGVVPAFLILGSMSVMSLLLATDWFFYSQFRSMKAASAARRTNARRLVDDEGSASSSAAAFRPSEMTGETLRPVPIPVSPGAKGFEHAKAEQVDARLRERALVDRVLEEARLELSATVLPPSAETELELPEQQDVDVASPREDDGESPGGDDPLDDFEARRLARRARREAARAAAALEFDPVQGAADTVESETEPRTSETALDGFIEIESDVEISSAPAGEIGDESQSEIHSEGLHPDEELGLAGLLAEPDPFGDLEDDDLLTKAGEALEKQWQGGDVGFAQAQQAGPDERAAGEKARANPGDNRQEHVEPRETEAPKEPSDDPFVADPDRQLDARSQPDREATSGDPRPSWREVLGAAASSPEDRDDGKRRQDRREDRPEEPEGAPEETRDDRREGERRIVIEPQPSARPMPEDEPADEPKDEPADEPVEQRSDELVADRSDEVAAPPSTVSQPAAGQQVLFDLDALDEGLVRQAAEVALTARRPTPSLIQRRLHVDGLEARRLLDRLAELGAVAEPVDGGAWLPLLSLEDWTSQQD